MGRKVKGYQQVHVYVKACEYKKFKTIAGNVTGLTFKEFVNTAVENFNNQFEKYLTVEKPINIIDLLRAEVNLLDKQIDGVNEMLIKREKES